MEAERRSTMSSLKGQLSNMESSMKSMKTTVIVGSVLTVACLAAVFGVTLLANEVSKEVKVSSGYQMDRSGELLAGQQVLTSCSRPNVFHAKNAFGLHKCSDVQWRQKVVCLFRRHNIFAVNDVLTKQTLLTSKNSSTPRKVLTSKICLRRKHF